MVFVTSGLKFTSRASDIGTDGASNQPSCCSLSIPNPSRLILRLRDLSLWKYVRKEGNTAAEALDEWCINHPEDAGLGEDTVIKAVQRIDKIMQRDA